MKILRDDADGLHLALAKQQTLDRIESLLAARRRIERKPCRILDRNVKQRHQCWQRRNEILVESNQLAAQLLANPASIVTIFDAEVIP